MPAHIKTCNCTGTPATDFQDKTYGKGLRVHNEGAQGKSFACTCCGKGGKKAKK